MHSCAIQDSTNTAHFDIPQKAMPIEPFRERKGHVDSFDGEVVLSVIRILIVGNASFRSKLGSGSSGGSLRAFAYIRLLLTRTTRNKDILESNDTILPARHDCRFKDNLDSRRACEIVADPSC